LVKTAQADHAFNLEEPTEDAMKHLILTVLFALSLLTSLARAESLGPADKTAVVGVITQQLQAFAADDATTAYSFAAPIVQGAFPSVDNFMATNLAKAFTMALADPCNA
jgi:Domain of unknown function (DUF4864)